jgi:C-methyltransferase C-terminal domain/Putative zinc binding domain
VDKHTCRACGQSAGDLVLDLGKQPACDYFPRRDDPGPDPAYPLQMWLCSSCGLAQLLADPTIPEEPKATEPAALVEQAADAVERVAAAGLLPVRGVVAEYGSPHGGSWLSLLAARGLVSAGPGESADVILDCFGMMHAADQYAAVAERTARVRPGGVLLVQYHSLNTVIRCGQWNALRHGHYAYYSTSALAEMLAQHGFSPRKAWQFGLYGGTVLLAAGRDVDGHGAEDGSVQAVLAEEARTGVRNPAAIHGLQRDAQIRAKTLHNWLVYQRSTGSTVLGYGAASRAVALLRQARLDRTLLPAVVDASPAKQGLRMPGTDIPIVSPLELAARRPDSVLVFVADLLAEVRMAFPEVEAAGGQWVDVEAHGSGGLQQHPEPG